LDRLAEKARRVGAGDLEGPLDLGQRDEIGQLAREMNAMCDRLAEANSRTAAETAAKIRAVEQLRHGDRLITVGRLGAGIAHELGTPLNVILGRAKLMKKGLTELDTRMEHLETISQQADRMSVIIRQLLDFARRREPKTSPTDLGAVAGAVIQLVQPLAHRQGVEVRLVSSESVRALGDSMRLEQVLSNLVVNAVHACEPGGHVVLSVGREQRDKPGSTAEGIQSFAVIRVSDDGHGMTEETRAQVFEPFFTTKETGQGTGLGLSVAHGIVEEHGGFILVETTLGQGSTFSVYLPIAP
jgi:signal transduction histidine kinase